MMIPAWVRRSICGSQEIQQLTKTIQRSCSKWHGDFHATREPLGIPAIEDASDHALTAHVHRIEAIPEY